MFELVTLRQGNGTERKRYNGNENGNDRKRISLEYKRLRITNMYRKSISCRPRRFN